MQFNLQFPKNRGTETEEQIQKRLRNAKGELEQGKSPGLFDHILVNDDLDDCYQILKVIRITSGTSVACFVNFKHYSLIVCLYLTLEYRASWA